MTRRTYLFVNGGRRNSTCEVCHWFDERGTWRSLPKGSRDFSAAGIKGTIRTSHPGGPLKPQTWMIRVAPPLPFILAHLNKGHSQFPHLGLFSLNLLASLKLWELKNNFITNKGLFHVCQTFNKLSENILLSFSSEFGPRWEGLVWLLVAYFSEPTF